MSEIRVTDIKGEDGSAAVNFSKGINISSGVCTATSFSGSGSGLTGLTDSQIPNLNASKINAGTLPVTRGGTGLTSLGAAGKSLKVNSSANALEYGDAGAWTKIASGTGPASSVTSIDIDNIFSDSYKFYKLYYSWAEDDWFKARYIKADGSVESGNVYLSAGQYARQNADDDGRYGGTNQNYAIYDYWNGADDCPAICEVSYWHPYASSRETIDFVNAAMVQGTQAVWQSGMNCNMNSYSVRGIRLFGSAGDSINSANFNYLVLGANI